MTLSFKFVKSSSKAMSSTDFKSFFETDSKFVDLKVKLSTYHDLFIKMSLVFLIDVSYLAHDVFNSFKVLAFLQHVSKFLGKVYQVVKTT